MGKFKKDLACNITLICVLAFSAIHLLLLTLNLFNITKFNLPSNFSYIFAYVLMIFCFALYVLGFWIDSIKTLKIPTWFKMMFYIAFFIFTNVYYIAGLYNNLFFVIIFVAYISFLLNICAISICFNINKDEKNKLKMSTKSLIFNTTTYAVALCSLALFIFSIAKIIFVGSFAFTSLTDFIIEMTTMLVVCAIMATILTLSHKKSKVIINNCLIKIVPKTITPSVKA